jgi:hypothetical protein
MCITVIACGHSWGIGGYTYRNEAGEEESGYGLYRPENPNDFFPDEQCCTEQELEAHAEAKRIWDKAHPKEPS